MDWIDFRIYLLVGVMAFVVTLKESLKGIKNIRIGNPF